MKKSKEDDQRERIEIIEKAMRTLSVDEQLKMLAQLMQGLDPNQKEQISELLDKILDINSVETDDEASEIWELQRRNR